MPAPTARQLANQRKRESYANESCERAASLVSEAKYCPCSIHIAAAHTALDGAVNAVTDARLWAGRLRGHEARHTYTLALNSLDKLRLDIPSDDHGRMGY